MESIKLPNHCAHKTADSARYLRYIGGFQKAAVSARKSRRAHCCTPYRFWVSACDKFCTEATLCVRPHPNGDGSFAKVAPVIVSKWRRHFLHPFLCVRLSYFYSLCLVIPESIGLLIIIRSPHGFRLNLNFYLNTLSSTTYSGIDRGYVKNGAFIEVFVPLARNRRVHGSCLLLACSHRVGFRIRFSRNTTNSWYLRYHSGLRRPNQRKEKLANLMKAVPIIPFSKRCVLGNDLLINFTGDSLFMYTIDSNNTRQAHWISKFLGF